MSSLFDELKEGLAIDPNDLDNALLEHPQLYFQICQEYSKAISLRDQRKDELKQVDAGLNFSVREELSKVTESIVTAAIDGHDHHINALRAYREASLRADEWGNLKAAFEQRSYALREFVDLYVASYSQQTAIAGPAHVAEEREAQNTRGALNKDRQSRRGKKKLSKAS